jgi:hypothetical protein
MNFIKTAADFSSTTDEHKYVLAEVGSLRNLINLGDTVQEQNMQNLKDEINSLRLLRDADQDQNIQNLKDEVESLRILVGTYQEQNNTRFQKLRENCQDLAIGGILLLSVYFLA